MTTLRRSNALCIRRSPKTPMRMSRSTLVDGAEHAFPCGGTTQYNGEGSASACGLAALNFAKTVFSMEQGGLHDVALLQAVMDRKCAEEATSICASWSGNRHLEVEDICHIPLFEKTLMLKSTTYGLPGVSEFSSLLKELSKLDSSAVAIIARPPEIIACLKLRVTTRNVFVIFDSHPRTSYPNGFGMMASTSIEGTARRLTELLRTAHLSDHRTAHLSKIILQRQITNYSGHVFVPHDVETSAPTLSQAVLKSSLAWLSITKTENSERSQNGSLKGEQQCLEGEIKEAEARNQRRNRLIQWWKQQQKFESSSGPSKCSEQPSAPPRHFSSSTRHSPHPTFSIASTSALNSFVTDSPSARSSSALALPPILPSDRADISMHLQHDEDSLLSARRAEPAKPIKRLFACGICLEEMPEDSIARPDPCGHTFCRECLREHVTTRLGEHRFPILCPTCTASKGKGKGAAGEVSEALALDLGLNDEQYSIWTEMEMAAFSILLHCRKCQRSMFVAKDEHEEVDFVTCPLPDCNHTWCKQCQQPIDFGGPKHSCDGSSELDHLMKQNGWKYCPTCKTPIQKVSGCNHMSCMTPACNTHFCYKCGDLIVKSALAREIAEAISAHFRRNCTQF